MGQVGRLVTDIGCLKVGGNRRLDKGDGWGQGWESLGRGGRGKGQWGGQNLGKGQKETSGKMYQMRTQDTTF